MNYKLVIILAVFLGLLIGCEHTVIIKRTGEEIRYVGRGNDIYHHDRTIIYGDNPNDKDVNVKDNLPEEKYDVKTDEELTGIDVRDDFKMNLAIDITADYPPGKITPDLILLNSAGIKNGDIVTSGNKQLKIEKFGYRTVEESINVPKEYGTYTLTRQMYCKERTINFDITDSRTGSKINPDKVEIFDRQIREGASLKPNMGSLKIQKDGYKSIVESKFELPVGEGAYIIKRTMESAKVKLVFDVRDADTKEKIKPDKIMLSSQLTTDGSFINPGSYKLEIRKNGYETKTKNISIPQKPVYTIRELLQKSKIKFSWVITGDYPRGEEIEVEKFILDGKELSKLDAAGNYKDNFISSGMHIVEVRDPRYEVHKEKINVSSGKRNFLYKTELISRKRILNLTIKYDVPPTKELKPCKILLAKDGSSQVTYITGGERVKPGQYKISVEREGYHPSQAAKRIWPGIGPIKIEVLLQAKPVVINAMVEFDIKPPKELANHLLTFIAKDTLYRQGVKPGGTIRPGAYYYTVEKPGYEMVGGSKRLDGVKNPLKDIMIYPSVRPITMRENMKALPRQISFDMTDENGIGVRPKSIFVVEGESKRNISFEDTYKPGKRYFFIAEFLKYKTWEKNIVIEPGVGPYVVKVELIPK